MSLSLNFQSIYDIKSINSFGDKTQYTQMSKLSYGFV